MSSRRDFIKDVCKLCALAGLTGLAATTLESCNSLKVVTATAGENNQLRVAVSAFEDKTQIIVRSSKLANDLLVHKRSDGSYGALLMQCTHESQPLTASGTALYCSSHGSKFDLEGNVLLAPATRALTKYPVTIAGSELLIQL